MDDGRIRINREHWNREAAEYQRLHAGRRAPGAVWGVWSIPEAEPAVLGDVAALLAGYEHTS